MYRWNVVKNVVLNVVVFFYYIFCTGGIIDGYVWRVLVMSVILENNH